MSDFVIFFCLNKMVSLQENGPGGRPEVWGRQGDMRQGRASLPGSDKKIPSSHMTLNRVSFSGEGVSLLWSGICAWRNMMF